MPDLKEPSTISPPPGAQGFVALLEAMRPTHWVKNAFVIAPILFAGAFLQAEAWWRCLLAVAAFNLLSSGVYLLNDICDLRADQAHPEKCHRPLASERLSVGSACFAAVVLLPVGLALSVLPGIKPLHPDQPLGGMGAAVWAGAYLVLNLLYSFWWKRYTVVDVIVVALGFVLRAMAGAAAIAVPISPWLVICTFTLCLFLALAKRRAELTELSPERAYGVRRANRGYRVEDLDFMLVVATALALTSYALYCLAPATVKRLGSAHMLWTFPLVMYGVLRFVRVGRRIRKGDIAAVLFADKVLWGVVILYIAFSAAIIRFGAHPVVRNILDSQGM
ncbi:MAG: UbiA prenyltransferase family protein [Phycisphaerae bacterium]|nr:UbiA prenyltransferase family protein [Phycisphaerae bacterium]